MISSHMQQLRKGAGHTLGSGNSRVGHRHVLAVQACKAQRQPEPHSPQMPVSRRQLQLLLGAYALIAGVGEAQAIGFQKELKRKKIPLEEYSTLDNGLKYFDLAEGRGEAVAEGSKVTVHFDCKYRGIDAVSSRQARTLGGNRTVAEPYEFIAGSEVSNKGRKINDSAGGLFVGGGGPKPPPALSTAVIGMKAGGKRTVRVPPELGYGAKGEQEIPPNESFDLEIEVLRIG